MTHIKSLFSFYALFLIFSFAYAQDSTGVFSPTTKLSGDVLFSGNPAFGGTAGLGYVQNGDFRFCLGARAQYPLGDRTSNNKRFVADLEANLDLRTFNNDAYSNNTTAVNVIPGVFRVCNFSPKVDMFAGLRAPVTLGRTKAEFDGQQQSADNISSLGLRADYGVSYKINESSWITASTSIAGWSRFTRKNQDNPDISTSDSSAWFGFGKNNSLKLSFNTSFGAKDLENRLGR